MLCGLVFLLFFVPLCTAAVISDVWGNTTRAAAMQGDQQEWSPHMEWDILLTRRSSRVQVTWVTAQVATALCDYPPRGQGVCGRAWKVGGSLRAGACQHCSSIPLVPSALHFTHLLRLSLCFPFLFEEACLILLTTLNEDKAHVCNNRLKLNFKQIIC